MLLGADEPIKLALLALNSHITGVPATIQPARSDTCLTALLESYGLYAGRFFVQKAFAGRSKEYAEEIIETTIQAFRNRLPQLDWLDEQTRTVADEKVSRHAVSKL